MFEASLVVSLVLTLTARFRGTGGRDAAGLLPLLQYLVKFLVDPRYSRLLLGVAHRVLDTYSGQACYNLYQHLFT